MAGGEGDYIYMDDNLYEAARSSEGADVILSVVEDDDDELFFLRLTPGDQNNALHVAAQHGNHKFISAVLARINPNHVLVCKHNSKGQTPLHLAAQSGSKETIQALLDAHDVRDNQGDTSHYIACWRERDHQGDTPLHIALRYGHDEIAQLMLGMDSDLVSLYNNVGESLAFLAAQNFCPNFLKRILDADGDGPCSVSFSGPFGQTAFLPARNLTGDIMSIAIKRRKHLLKVQDSKGKTVLDYAVEEERISIVERLLKADSTLAYLHDKDGLTPLHIAAKRGLFRMMQTILTLSPQSIAIRDRRHGQTALHVVKMDACSLEECLQSTRMKELINLVDNNGNTPLHLALFNSDFATADKLLEVNDINWRLTNKKGYSPMDLCTSDGQIPLKLKRLASESRVKEETNMEILFHKDVIHVDQLLDQYTWDECLTYKGPQGDSILHIAARDGNMKFINRVHECDSTRLLLLSGQNYKGETPLHLAAEHGRLEVVNAILSMITSTDNSIGDDHENPSAIVAIHNGDVDNDQQYIDTSRDDHENSSAIVDIENGDVDNDQLQDIKPWGMKSANGDTPIHKAVRNGHAEIASLLLRRDPELISSTNNEKESVLYVAADSICYYFIRDILSQNIEYDESITSGRGGQNVLHAAARAGGVTFRLFKRLIREQPDLLKEIDDNGKTPLHYAIEEGLQGTARQLLRQDKSAAFVYDNEGFTPLLRAAVLGFTNCLRSILHLCPQSAELRDLSHNRTVLHLAKMSRFLLQMCMESQVMVKLVNEIDKDGNTALHCATLDGDTDKVLVLLKTQGINWKIRNKQHKSPIELCRELKRSGDPEQRQIFAALVSLKGGGVMMPTRPKFMLWVMNPLFAYNEMVLTNDDLKKLLNNIAVAAALLVTITFAAAFTIPGGYDQNTGEAMLMKRAAVKVFIASDVLAMLMAISILVWYTIGAGRRRRAKLKKLAIDSIIMLQISLAATVVAFISGVYAIGSHVKPVITVPILISVLFNLIFLFRPEFIEFKF